jgi:hypothetical protein
LSPTGTVFATVSEHARDPVEVEPPASISSPGRRVAPAGRRADVPVAAVDAAGPRGPVPKLDLYHLTRHLDTRHAGRVDIDPRRPEAWTTGTRHEIVYLDPRADRPVSQYSPEGEIRMMGDFAAGLNRRSNVSRPMAFALVAIILLPILISVFAVVSSW